MTGAFSKIRDELLYSAIVSDAKGNVRKRIDKDNRKSAVIWSIVEIAFWILCLAMSVNDPMFEKCRILYIVVLALSIITLVLAAFIAPKSPNLTRFIVVAMQLILIGAGIGLAFLQWDVRSATFIAAVLIVPVMFVTDTLQTLVCVVFGIVVFMIIGPNVIAPDVYSWTLKSLVIFSIAGVLIGHIINKTRFERYAFAESALELAELRNKFAYYDQLTELQNRRAYSEKIAQLATEMPPTCCVVSADINGLKQTNDTYGHAAGDEVIIGAAECLRQCFEDVGEIYRLGGDEFCIIITKEIDDIPERLRRLEQITASWRGKLIEGLSISYGVAITHNKTDIDSTLRAADHSMYEYKRNYYMTSGIDRRRAVAFAE